jgi:hypothetical protein
MKKAVRREPDLKLPFLSRSNRWLRGISHLIPSILAAYEIDLLLLPSEWAAPPSLGGLGSTCVNSSLEEREP